jgi:predicted glycosyltransferase
MRVWVDVLTPKQVLFFAPLVEELTRNGCTVLATSRRYREIEPMAKLQGLDLKLVGERGGSDLRGQLEAATARQKDIIPIVDGFGPDVSVSVASAVCARVSFGLRVKHVAVNDSPHSLVAGKLALPLSHHLMCPWIIPFSSWAPYGLARSQISRYRALDPAAWLKRKPRRGPVPKLSANKPTITVRLEESFAPYMAGTDGSWNDRVLEAIALKFSGCNLVALCRYGEQLDLISQKFGSRYVVPEEAIDGRSLLERTDVFIGMGGTMTTESALMGVPTISMFQGDLYTERYLKAARLLTKARSIEELTRFASVLLRKSRHETYSRRAKRVLDSMEDPIPRIYRLIRSIPS